MTNTQDAKSRIRAKVIDLAKELGNPVDSFSDDQVIPASGILDSASIMQLILWYEDEFGVSTDDEELTVDNFGTVSLMAGFLTSR